MTVPRVFESLFWHVILLLLVISVSHGGDPTTTVRIGVLAEQGIDRCRSGWQPTAACLSKMLPDHRFEVIPLAPASVEQALAEKAVDFILTNPPLHAALANRYRLEAIAKVCSTRPYPEWPLAKLPHTCDKLAAAVPQALMQMEQGAPATEAAPDAGQGRPPDDHCVHNSMQARQPGSSGLQSTPNPDTVYRHYKKGLISAGIVICLLLITAAGVTKLNTKLSGSNTDLLEEIEKRKKSEARRYESETRLQTILDRSIAGVFIIDPATHVILDVNQSALEMAGADRDALVGRKCFGVICPEREGQCPVTDLGLAFNRAERPLLRADGSRCTVLKTVTWFNLNGKVLLLDSFIDISELKETQFNLESALAAANCANRTKDQFLANMSHELRTPMNGIIGMTGILQNTDLSPEQVEFAQIIMKSSEGLLGIINNILDYTHIASNDRKSDSTDFDLHTLISEVMAAATPAADEKKLVCSHAVDEGVPASFRGDRRRLKKILQILLDNAVKFTPRGTVSLHVARGPDRDEKCPVSFKVHDTGIGIEAERVNQLFTPFSQADDSFTRKYGGIGLGLALAKHFIDMLDGHVSVDSIPGKGSTFQFTLPLTPSVRKPQPPPHMGGGGQYDPSKGTD